MLIGSTTDATPFNTPKLILTLLPYLSSLLVVDDHVQIKKGEYPSNIDHSQSPVSRAVILLKSSLIPSFITYDEVQLRERILGSQATA